jgi:hypothetical protein
VTEPVVPETPTHTITPASTQTPSPTAITHRLCLPLVVRGGGNTHKAAPRRAEGRL